ncbi:MULTISPECIES: DUF2163 domain-containing protein [unclassified Sphingomonas]|uniref:DUF2163 domain-containing protein n=1 Tax=unclassified Sphingomonas TaxID=196159 RepID=UPI0006FF499D|nr:MULTISPECIES: DUF2163 domain-containing protein [unclassified Sphingomonas]KQM57898.1 hypothetical protein ASE65_12095 [Sphingomonas sp. Leaf16]KQN12817.1 hypothetical protein ASE81_05715 [Sphingomonas sp. Leaf29]KQN19704.1 hypothetical protein ASE83_05640 [Sphingomonas sp. Leaf32]
MSAVSTLTLCWRIERRDGVTIGLTAHERDVVVDGLTCRAAPGMTPSAIVRDDTLDAPAMTVEGALGHAAIDERDLRVGRYDGARVAVFAVDWERPGAPVPVASGRIGTVETGRGSFAAELLGGEVRLEAPVVEATSPGCRATLGDRRCGVAMRGRRRIVRVSAQEGERLVLAAGAGFARGRLRWIGGMNGGLSAFIVAADAEGVTLEAPPRFEGAGALVELSEGCDGTLATCRDRFGNVANFRGEPHLPGIDLLTRYPGG